MIPPPPPAPQRLDARAPVFESATIWLPELFVQVLRTGSPTIEGRTFRRCTLEGPALLLPLRVDFDGCDFGESGGDIRNLLVRPLATKVIGSIPFTNCRFESCLFVAVAFTGDDQFLEMMSQVRRPDGPSGS